MRNRKKRKEKQEGRTRSKKKKAEDEKTKATKDERGKRGSRRRRRPRKEEGGGENEARWSKTRGRGLVGLFEEVSICLRESLEADFFFSFGSPFFSPPFSSRFSKSSWEDLARKLLDSWQTHAVKFKTGRRGEEREGWGCRRKT